MICRGAEILNIRAEGVPIGLLESTDYEEITFQAQAGDVVVLYSDGITEARNAAGTLFGVGRLMAHVEANAGLERTVIQRTAALVAPASVAAIARAAFVQVRRDGFTSGFRNIDSNSLRN